MNLLFANKLSLLWLTLSVLCFCYGAIVRAVGSGTSFFIVWLALGAFFLFCSVASGFHLWSHLPLAIRRVGLLVVILAILFFAIVEACIIHQFSEKPATDADYLLVLGAQIYDSGPSVVLRYRLDTAAEYLSNNPDTRCIVSGGQGWNEPYTEAQGMYEYLVKKGVSPERIILEEQAENTVQNIQYSISMLKSPDASVAIVTNNFHMFRAYHIAQKQGLKNLSCLSSPSTPLYLPNNLLREFLGTVKDGVSGNLQLL